tara:strand:- start:31 stop:639 length:609 start_codon:yes stop_codon:yes gene_type:complete
MNDIPKYEIFDDVLTKEEQDNLNNIFFDSYFPFYVSEEQDHQSVDDFTYKNQADENTVESQIMVHTFINDISDTNKEISKFYEKIEHILQKFYEKTKIKFSGIIRCKLNLQYRVADYDKNNYQCPHVDQDCKHKVLIYYPYTSDGDIFLFNQLEPKKYEVVDRIKPIGGRFLLMDKMFHANQPPILNKTRMSLNYNLVGDYK